MTAQHSRICAVISDMLGVDIDTVVPEAKLEKDLDADSLDRIELVMRFEDEFAIEIPDEKVADLVTVQQCMDYIDRATAA